MTPNQLWVMGSIRSPVPEPDIEVRSIEFGSRQLYLTKQLNRSFMQFVLFITVRGIL